MTRFVPHAAALALAWIVTNALWLSTLAPAAA